MSESYTIFKNGESTGLICTKAKNSYERMMGLMFKENIQDSDAFLISPCNSIHTFFMNFPIHAVFLNKSGLVVKTHEALSPWKMTNLFLSARSVIEIDARKHELSFNIGDKVEIKCLN